MAQLHLKSGVACFIMDFKGFLLGSLYVVAVFAAHGLLESNDNTPRFGDMISNVTVSIGREATFTCVVDDLGTYKVAWLRVDTQTILTIATHVITKNHRISVAHSDRRVWFLYIQDVRESDRGWYMCQINTDPMKSHIAFLDVVVPPDIMDYPTSGDQVVREGSNVTLRCAATGVPTPSVTWRRETAASGVTPASVTTDSHNASLSGANLTFLRVNRLQMGAYLCIASNGIPPSVSKRVILIVHFPPMVWIQNQLIGAHEGDAVILDCHSEAFPKSINYWTFRGEIITHANSNYETNMVEKGYEVDMSLKIKKVNRKSFGSYTCISKNSLGETDGNIKVFPLPGSKLSNKLNIHQDSKDILHYTNDVLGDEEDDFEDQNNASSARIRGLYGRNFSPQTFHNVLGIKLTIMVYLFYTCKCN